MALRKFIIERDIPAAGSLDRDQLRGAAAKSNGVLRQLGPDIQWVESYVGKRGKRAGNGIWCCGVGEDTRSSATD